MRLMRYMYTLAHVSGKSFATADALSRASRERLLAETEVLLTDVVTVHANIVDGVLPAREMSLAEIRARQPSRWQNVDTDMFYTRKPRSGILRQQLREDSQVSRNDIVRPDCAPQIDLRKT